MRLALDTKTGKVTVNGEVTIADAYAAHEIMDEAFHRIATKQPCVFSKESKEELTSKDVDDFLDMINMAKQNSLENKESNI